jgi:hypothetical protein
VAWYRTSRDAEWRTGITRCVSTTGAVITCDDPPSVSDPIIIVILLSASGCLVGRGHVIRAQPSAGPDIPARFSVAVDHYGLEHRASIVSNPSLSPTGASTSGDLRVI